MIGAAPRHGYKRAALVNPLTLNVGQDGCLFLVTPANLRQDNLDTAAAVGQPVGMFIDTWVANTLGANIVTNGDFPVNTTGWTASSSTLSVVSARLRVTNTTTAIGFAFQSLATTAGRTYKCTVTLVTNASGARIGVGTASSNSTLFNSGTIAAGVTGTFTFYFTATSATSFILLRTENNASAGLFTEWDDVTAKHMPGKHLIQQTATARPILRQHAAGWYYLEPDGVDDWMPGPLFTTLQLPSYLCELIKRTDPALSVVHFGMIKNNVNHHLIRSGSSNNRNANAVLREGSLGATTASIATNALGVDRVDAIDSLAIVGAQDNNSGRTNPTVGANSWLAGTQLTLAGPCLFSLLGTTASAQTNWFMGAVWMNSAPTAAERAGVRAYFNAIVGAD